MTLRLIKARQERVQQQQRIVSLNQRVKVMCAVSYRIPEFVFFLFVRTKVRWNEFSWYLFGVVSASPIALKMGSIVFNASVQHQKCKSQRSELDL